MPATVPYLLGENDAFCSGDLKDLGPEIEIDPVSEVCLVCKLATIEGAFSRRVEEIEVVMFIEFRLLDTV